MKPKLVKVEVNECGFCKVDGRVFQKPEVQGNCRTTHVCEYCGAKRDAVTHKWKKHCQKCDKLVTELFGLFVPHLCKECENKATEECRARGDICGMCRQTRNHCTC